MNKFLFWFWVAMAIVFVVQWDVPMALVCILFTLVYELKRELEDLNKKGN